MKQQTIIIALILVIGLGAAAVLTYISIQNAPPQETSSSNIPLVTQTIDVISFEPSMYLEEEAEITWRINSDESLPIEHTAVHYGPVSLSRPQSPQDYPFLTELQAGTIPGTFIVPISFGEEGLVYFRAHAIIKGNHVWSTEYVIASKPHPDPNIVSIPPDQQGGGGGKGGSGSGGSGGSSGNQSPPQTYTYNLEADDLGFYHGEEDLTSLPFKTGDKVTFIFKTRIENVYYGGLEFKSPHFSSGQVLPGNSYTAPQITLQNGFVVTSYWPESSVEKANLEIRVS